MIWIDTHVLVWLDSGDDRLGKTSLKAIDQSFKGDMAIQSALLPHFHGDPADRMIMASALHINAALCTAVKKILD